MNCSERTYSSHCPREGSAAVLIAALRRRSLCSTVFRARRMSSNSGHASGPSRQPPALTKPAGPGVSMAATSGCSWTHRPAGTDDATQTCSSRASYMVLPEARPLALGLLANDFLLISPGTQLLLNIGPREPAICRETQNRDVPPLVGCHAMSTPVCLGTLETSRHRSRATASCGYMCMACSTPREERNIHATAIGACPGVLLQSTTTLTPRCPIPPQRPSSQQAGDAA